MAQQNKTAKVDIASTLRGLEASKEQRALEDRAMLVAICAGERGESGEAILEAAERVGISGQALTELQRAFERVPEIEQLEAAADEAAEVCTEAADRIREEREKLQLAIKALDDEYKAAEQRRNAAFSRLGAAKDSLPVSFALLADHTRNESDRTRRALLAAAEKAVHE